MLWDLATVQAYESERSHIPLTAFISSFWTGTDLISLGKLCSGMTRDWSIRKSHLVRIVEVIMLLVI